MMAFDTVRWAALLSLFIIVVSAQDNDGGKHFFFHTFQIHEYEGAHC